MTQTQSILRSFLICSLGGTLLSCAAPIQEGGNYCFNIDEGETCPDLDSVNENKLPYEPSCSTIEYIEASDGPEQSDTPTQVGMDTIPSEDKDSCCYTASYRKLRDQPECVHGRALMEDGKATFARVRPSVKNPWTKNLSKSINPKKLSRKQREIAGKFYLQTALYEHASIASFQKFTLDLMKFGAPPHLLDKAQQATRDEIAHAQMAFSIATDLLQENLHPHRLDYTPKLCESIKEFARSTLQEGAIGETIAVLIASEQLRVSKDHSVREFLQQVVEDEAKHAELAWETIRWCLEKDPSVREVLVEALEQKAPNGFSHYPTEAIDDVGIPNPADLQKFVQKGFERVIIPSIQTLLAQS